MQQILERDAVCKPPHLGCREFLIAAVRAARTRVQLLQTEIDEVGIALSNQMVTPEVAVGWLDEIGALPFVSREIGGAQ